MQKQHLAATSLTPFSHPNVDRENGIIKNLIMMEEGPIKWDRGMADKTMLQTLMDCALERYGPEGSPVIFNPNTMDHGPGGIAGAAKSYRIEMDPDTKRNALYCDLHCLKSFGALEYLYELAERQPKTLGLSVEYYPEEAPVNSRTLMRAVYYDGAAIVYTPAATPGMFCKAGTITHKAGKIISIDTNEKADNSRSTLIVLKPATPTLLTFKKHER